MSSIDPGASRADSKPAATPYVSLVTPASKPPIVVHSHLRWSFVWQRPQQTHARLVRDREVFFVEEPVFGPGKTRLQTQKTPSGVTVVVPHLPESCRDDLNKADAMVVSLLSSSTLPRRTAGGWQWLYSPIMEPRLDAFPDSSLVVYDCMDELTAFAFARPELALRETRLLGRADVVFTGGRALYEARRARHRSVHLFGCGVDAAHFAKAAEAAPPADLAALPAPRAVYIGVIDERIDYPLLAELAEGFGGSVAMVGPVVKVDPASLPKHPNLHFLGPRTFDELPGILAGADLCLMPFALNDATRYINPTKTLEYLASGRPVLSTPIADVVAQFSDVVAIAPREEFCAKARAVLARPHDPKPGLARAAKSSWDGIVEHMERIGRNAMRPGRRPRISRALVEGTAP
jgi:glycosyltransferase involved in cell wall biosynthesis